MIGRLKVANERAEAMHCPIKGEHCYCSGIRCMFWDQGDNSEGDCMFVDLIDYLTDACSCVTGQGRDGPHYPS